ncbi:NAD(P)/FAD-dependent oxidoreductase [Calidifontibacter terrae]
MHNGEVSWWWREQGGAPSLGQRRPALQGQGDADVCIVGGGYTGLWTALRLTDIDPSLRVVILESEHVGFGASGRNGGWLTASLPGSRAVLNQASGADGTRALEQALREEIDAVIATADREGIDADIVKGGELRVATSGPQLGRLERSYASEHAWGTPDEVWLEEADLAQRLRLRGALGAIWTPHCARIHPVKLVTGLAAAIERRGVVIHEDSAVLELTRNCVRTKDGSVRADVVLRCTEGFTANFPGERRTWLPMNSSMVVTRQLSDAQWATIGWDDAAVLGDEAHGYIYAQRTADGRIAIGGRGVPYKYGSRTDLAGDTPQVTITQLRASLEDLFPDLTGIEFDHAWSGVLGVPRDWTATVTLADGVGYAGGYVGHGVTSSALAGRTLADLVLGRDTALTALPWVNRQVRKWEPEPLRYAGVMGLYAAYRRADHRETLTGRSSGLASLADKISRKP